MLTTLDIRDILIIDRLTLDLKPGLNALTGETGAGKSILLDALGFVLGWRGRADVLRAGASLGEVTAAFQITADHAAQAVLQAAGLPGDDTLILRRSIAADGRKSAFVNDRRAGAEILRDLGETLVELHGQADDRGLLNPRGHRALLDAVGRLDLGPVRQAWATLRQARADLAAAEAALATGRAEESFLRHAVAELDALDPQPGEEAALDTARRLMQAAERIRADIVRAAAALGDDGAEGAIRNARRWLEGVADRAEGRLEAPLAALSRVMGELSEAQSGVEACLEALTFDTDDLERCEERLFAIRALARKHGVLADDLGAFAADQRARLAVLDNGAAHLAGLQQALAAAEATYQAQAGDITARRRATAARLDADMARELIPLKLDRAVFLTEVTPGEAGPDGVDLVTFTAATNPGAPSGPLNKIASGGELSRFLLALKVCLTQNTPGLTMIFDEIDRGVGGATADAVGRRLRSLAEGAQVLVVTHSPQVAAQAGHHWRVEKRVDKTGQTLSAVTALPENDRVEEIARMLAGDVVTDAARAAAGALLAAT
ncbi:MAG: DNA repair protein RecN [Pseudomonadota bacterium]